MMFKLRREQIETFRTKAIDDFEHRAVKHLRGHLADHTRAFTDDELRARVRSCIARASTYGFTSEKQVVCFIDATYLLGEGFDSDPLHQDLVEVMQDTERDPTLRAGVMLGTACNRQEILKTGVSSDGQPDRNVRGIGQRRPGDPQDR